MTSHILVVYTIVNPCMCEFVRSILTTQSWSLKKGKHEFIWLITSPSIAKMESALLWNVALCISFIDWKFLCLLLTSFSNWECNSSISFSLSLESFPSFGFSFLEDLRLWYPLTFWILLFIMKRIVAWKISKVPTLMHVVSLVSGNQVNYSHFYKLYLKPQSNSLCSPSVCYIG